MTTRTLRARERVKRLRKAMEAITVRDVASFTYASGAEPMDVLRALMFVSRALDTSGKHATRIEKGDTLDEALAKATADVERWIANLDADEDAPEPEPRAFVGYFDDVNDAQDALARERAAREAVERERDALRARLKCKHRQCSRELDDRCGGYCLPCAENLDLRPPEGGCASCERKATP